MSVAITALEQPKGLIMYFRFIRRLDCGAVKKDDKYCRNVYRMCTVSKNEKVYRKCTVATRMDTLSVHLNVDGKVEKVGSPSEYPLRLRS